MGNKCCCGNNPNTDQLGKTDSFEKDITSYNQRIEKVSAIMVVIERKLQMRPDEQKKKNLIAQLVQANRLRKKYDQTRTLLIKQQLNIAGNRQNMKMLQIIKRSNEINKNSEAAVRQAEIEGDKYRLNIENNKELKQLIDETMKNNSQGDNFDQQFAALEAKYA